MAFLKVGEKDRDGRQKRIEHTGRYLRASRTGGVALRAQVKAAGVNLTGNTSRGVRVSTRLARNTQVALQNGRFILRGRYGSDAAKVNLSKSGVSVSTRTGLGTINWVRPGRSSVKVAGVQLRGQKAAAINGVVLAIAALAWAARLMGQTLLLLGRGLGGVIQWGVGEWQQALLARERLDLGIEDLAPPGEGILADHGVLPAEESVRDLFAALLFVAAVMGRGETRLAPAVVHADAPGNPFADALAEDVRVAGEQLRTWLADVPDNNDPIPILSVLHHLALGFAARTDEDMRTEAVFAVDDACLALGERTILQDAMLDILVESLGVDLTIVGDR